MAPSIIPTLQAAISPPVYLPRTRARGGSDPSKKTGGQLQQQLAEPQWLRQRQSCSTLYYTEDYRGYVHECSTPGEPIKEPWLIDPPREIDTIIQAARAFYYIRYRLKRYVTPRSKEFLQKYESSLRDYLDKPEDPEKKTVVITMNSVLHSKSFLYAQSHIELESATQAVEELAKLRYYADYGDYVASLCTDFRNKCVASKVKNVDILLGKSWGQVREELTKEDLKEERFRAWSPTGPGPYCPMAGTIALACEKLALDYKNVRYCIDWYARRNDQSHSGVGFYIKSCNWEDLGAQLLLDIKQVPSIFGKDDQAKMKEALERIKDKYFFRLDDNHKLPSKEAELLKEKREKRLAAKRENQRRNILLKEAAKAKRAKEEEAKNVYKAELEELAEGK
ncbi:MAG: hypothetical protein L6R38_000681 [Xanthoria sp. 2 TBL-2021]|nr:MAG: hypothetical protein L6R38_000681 [Xanthoria sp. 2 TBL-2021]